MTPAELREGVVVELEVLEAIVQELLSLQADVADRDPIVRERTVAASAALCAGGQVLSASAHCGGETPRHIRRGSDR